MERLLKYQWKKFLFGVLLGLVFALLFVGSYVEFIEGISLFAVKTEARSGLSLTETLFLDKGFTILKPICITTLIMIFLWKNKETNGRVGEFLTTLPLKNGARDILDFIMLSVIIVISTMASLLHMLFVQNRYNKTLMKDGNKAGIDADFIAAENRRLVTAYVLFLLFLLILFSVMYIITISTKNIAFAVIINLGLLYMTSFYSEYAFDVFFDVNISANSGTLVMGRVLLLLCLACMMLTFVVARTKELSNGKFFYNIYGEIMFSLLAGVGCTFFVFELFFNTAEIFYIGLGGASIPVFSVIAFILVHPFSTKKKNKLEVD